MILRTILRLSISRGNVTYMSLVVNNALLRMQAVRQILGNDNTYIFPAKYGTIDPITFHVNGDIILVMPKPEVDTRLHINKAWDFLGTISGNSVYKLKA